MGAAGSVSSLNGASGEDGGGGGWRKNPANNAEDDDNEGDGSGSTIVMKGSSSKNQPGGIEQKIPVEFKPRKKLGKSRHSHGPPHLMSFRSLSNSFTTAGQQSKGGGTSQKMKGASLRSVLSNDLDLEVREGAVALAELEKIRREYENFKLSKQNEIADMQKREKKLESENKRLRGEVQALQKTCARLRQERDAALDSENQALERAAAFEQDRDNIQNQLRMMQNYDMIVASGATPPLVDENAGFAVGGGGSYVNESEHGTSDTSSCSPQPRPLASAVIYMAQNSVQSSVFLPDAQNNPLMNNPDAHTEDLGNGRFKFEANVDQSGFIPSTRIDDHSSYLSLWPEKGEKVFFTLNFVIGHFESQLASDVESFCQVWAGAYYNSLLENHGISMNYTQKQFSADSLSQAATTANIIILFLEKKLSEMECKTLENILSSINDQDSSVHIPKPDGLKLLVCFKQVEQQSTLNSKMVRFKKVLSKLNSSVDQFNTVPIENYSQMEPLVSLVNESVDQFVIKHFSQGTLGECPCYRDKHGALYQRDAFASRIPDNISISPSVQQYVFCIEKHIFKEGQVLPLLIKSDPGQGKSTVLASFLKKYQNSHPSSTILYHFVESTAISKDGTLMVERFTRALKSLKAIKSPREESYDDYFDSTQHSFGHILESYPRNGALNDAQGSSNAVGSDGQNPASLIIAIDSADKLPVPSNSTSSSDQRSSVDLLNWIHQLPDDVRVILSVDNSTCPGAWANFPSVYLKAPPPTDEKSSPKKFSEFKLKIALELGLASPFLFKLLLKADSEVIQYDHTFSRSSSSSFTLVIDWYFKTISDSLGVPLNNIYQILYILNRSYLGIKSNWVLDLMLQIDPKLGQNFEKKFVSFLKEFEGMEIISKRLGNIVITNDFISKSVLLYCEENLKLFIEAFPQHLDEFFQSFTFQDDHTPLEIILEVTQLYYNSRSAIFASKLQDLLSKIVNFMHLLKFDFTHILVNIFGSFGIDKSEITDQFEMELMQLEQQYQQQADSMGEDTLDTLTDTLETFASFNKNLGFYSKAAHQYHRSVEVREMNLEPDHPSVCRPLYLNALLHFHWDKIDVAETLLKRAIEISESAENATEEPDYRQMVLNYDLLCGIYQRLGKSKPLEGASKRLAYLKSMTYLSEEFSLDEANCRWPMTEGDQSMSNQTTPRSGRAMHENESDSLAKANFLNEHAVLTFLHGGNAEDAENYFKSSLSIKRQILGQDHLDCSQSYFNLAGLYLESKQFSKSCEYFEKALAIRKTCQSSSSSSNVSSIFSTYRFLALAYRKAGNSQKALETLNELLKLNISNFGASHQFVATCYANIASVHCEMKQFSEALPLYERALALYQETLGANDSKVSQTLANMALLKFELQDYESAAALYKQAQQSTLGVRSETFRGPAAQSSSCLLDRAR